MNLASLALGIFNVLVELVKVKLVQLLRLEREIRSDLGRGSPTHPFVGWVGEPDKVATWDEEEAEDIMLSVRLGCRSLLDTFRKPPWSEHHIVWSLQKKIKEGKQKIKGE